jgi:ABC-type transporter Mla subunit MlaD
VNDLLNDTNRGHISASLEELNAMLADARPKTAKALANVQTATEQLPEITKNIHAASEKMTPLLDDLKATVKQGRELLAHTDAILLENRPEIRGAIADLRRTLDTATKTTELLRLTLDRNGENLDETLMNVRVATYNLKEMTDTVKRKPSVLIRGETGKDRVPGATK